MKSYQKLLGKLEEWEKILKLVRLLKPGGLYKFWNKEEYFIIIPSRYKLVALTCYVVAFNTSRKTVPGKYYYNFPSGTMGRMTWVYGCIINTYNIEPFKLSDLPLYVNAQYRGPMFEELLSGKRRLKCM